VTAILTCCATGLTDNSMDALLLYDTYHDLEEPEGVLPELQQVLKPAGLLSFSDHHLRKEEVVVRVKSTQHFRLLIKGQNTYTFSVSA